MQLVLVIFTNTINHAKKHTVIETLDLFDDEFDTEKLIEKLLFVAKVEKGVKDVEQGKIIDYQVAKQRFFDKWDK